MHAIYKYPLQITDVQRISVADPVRALSVQIQYGVLCLWYEVRPDGPIKTVEVFIAGTGHKFYGALVDNDYVYVGTVQFQDALVWRLLPRRMKFRSITHARAVRDRLATIALCASVPVETIEQICRAEGNFRKLIKHAQHDCILHWDGNGIPDWTYLDKLGDAVEYIRLAELAGVPANWSRCPTCGATPPKP